MTVELPVNPRVLNARLPLPGAGLAVNPVAFCVTASMTLCWPRSAMVSAVMTSTLAGVCSRVRLRRLAVEAGAVRFTVGEPPDVAALGVCTTGPGLGVAIRFGCGLDLARRTAG